MKKLISLIGAGAMLLSLATPAFAHHHRSSGNRAEVTQVTSSSANTGINEQINEAVATGAHVDGEVEAEGNNYLITKRAESTAVGVVVANTDVNATCGSCHYSRRSNSATVYQATSSSANTGLNTQINGAYAENAHVDGDVEAEGTNNLTAGGANSTAVGVTVVNTQVAF